jgi:hypothetical protein
MKCAPLLLGCVVTGCMEPTFVSLGHNDEAVVSVAADTGSASAPSADAGRFPISGSPPACPEGAGSVALTSACETRRPITCPDVDFPAQEALYAVLSSLLRECGETVSQVRVAFAGGCAERFELAESSSATALAARDCIALRLDAERYDCAAELACGGGATFGVPSR